MKKNILIPFLYLLFFSYCNSCFSQNTPLENHEWILARLLGENVPEYELTTIYFSSFDGKADGRTFCNEYMAPYFLREDNKISFSPLRLTKKICGLSSKERQFVQAMESVDNYMISDGILRLLEGNNIKLTFYSGIDFPWDEEEPIIEVPDTSENNDFLWGDVYYEYDELGNRILRYVIYLNTKSGYTKSGESSKFVADTNYQEEPIISKLDEFVLKVYPNPTKGNLKVEINGESEILNSQVEIFNSNGKMIFSLKKIQREYDLNLFDYPDGIYILRMTLNGKPYDWKIIKK